MGQEEVYEFYPVVSLDELPSGERIFLEIDNMSIVIFNIAGDVYALEDRCTHDNGPLGEGEIEGFEIICPRHGARFDVRDGRALTLPAVEPTRYFPTRIIDNQIEIGIPEN
ncbi:MAG: non-heme iron oxygenase ferredoxin subunit [Anaerolineaceae bacterium]|jgi:3-phenylpropionate/trans-cinnamate dioxygenase ferredoxin subunit|nr:non-heme iron oxygenase ferredoxin subunit [Anaerolineaceae bacterium]